MTAICMYLSTDAYIEWEDQVRIVLYSDCLQLTQSQVIFDGENATARGVIATPFDVKPFQVSFMNDAKESTGAHYTWECSTTYSKEDEEISSNPISGIYPLNAY